MKSHPDAASRSAAEVVTQLPVPSRLGMLRFERLNEPSWSLLFLDPACERQLGVSAGELCALLDCPYASLMEPEARYQLHDDIQRQLASTQHYSVRYRLHTPNGALHLLEIGESFQQRGRFLLRGYLLVTAEAGENLAEQRLQELEEQNSKLQTSLELYQHSQEEHLQHLIRSRAQQSLIVRLARHRYSALDPLKEAAELITQAACETYDVARASIWHLIGDHLEPVAMYRRDIDRHELPAPMDASRFPRYLDALHSGRAIDAHNAQRDPRTSELTRAYLKPLGISALLDASIRLGGEVVAVLCLEHIGPARTWQADEIAFAGELADQFAQVMSNQQRRDATSALFLFQRAVEQSANAFLLFDRDGLVQYVNPSFTAITQYGAEEVQGRRISQLPALENLGDLLFDAQTGLAERNSWQGEFRSRRKNLEPYWGQLSISKVYNDDGELTHYIGIYEDITQSKLAQQRIERLAYSDNLTGLGNRPYFIRCLEERFARRDSQAFSLLLVDIDNFKRINDSLGHQTGDKLLANLARRLRNSLGQNTSLARFASNEFAVLLDGAEEQAGLKLAQELLSTLDKPLFVDNQLISITGSVGLACAPRHGDDPHVLMKHAGLALHKAKANGKHQVQLFTEALNEEANYKLFVENNLRRALTQNELEVYYQPKLCLKSGQLVGLEALLRWHHPEKGMISPEQFISVAEETGLIIPIGKWVVRQACRASLELAALGMGQIQVAINLSAKQFTDPDLVGSIATILAEEQMPAHLLEVELTESAVFENGKQLELTALEYKLLSLLMQNVGRVVTRELIFEKIWDVSGNFVNDNTLTVYIKRIRKKLDADIIKTVKGMGYQVAEVSE